MPWIHQKLIAPHRPVRIGTVAFESLFVAVELVGKRLVPVGGFVD